MEYPKYKYHATEAPVLVHSQEEEDALDSGYENSPAAFEDTPTLADELAAETDANSKQDAKDLARVDLATAQRTVKRGPGRPKTLKAENVIHVEQPQPLDTQYVGADAVHGADTVQGSQIAAVGE